MPRTATPPDVVMTLIVLMGALILVLYLFWGTWGFSAACIILALTTPTYAIFTPQYHAGIVLDEFSKRQRTIFQGLNFKKPWETLQTLRGHPTFIDLRVDLHETINDTYVADDALMEVSYVYTVRPHYSESYTASDKAVRTFASYTPAAIKRNAKALVSQLISDHFSGKKGDDLLNKEAITKEIERIDSDDIQKYEEIHGSDLEFTIEDSDFSERAQEFRDMISKADSFAQAKQKLVENNMQPEVAEQIVKLMAFPENLREWNVKLDAPDLKNLRNFTFGWGAGGFGGGSGKGSGKGGHGSAPKKSGPKGGHP